MAQGQLLLLPVVASPRFDCDDSHANRPATWDIAAAQATTAPGVPNDRRVHV